MLSTRSGELSGEVPGCGRWRGDRHAVAAQRFDRRQLLLLEEVKSPGKRTGDCARLFHAADALLTRELYVIGRERTMIRRQLRRLNRRADRRAA